MRGATCQLQIVSGSFFWKPLFRKSGPKRKYGLGEWFDGSWPHSGGFCVAVLRCASVLGLAGS